jgi:hypothetical protein
MLTGLDVSDPAIIAMNESWWQETAPPLERYLTMFEVEHSKQGHDKLVPGRVYLLRTPSLNILGCFHEVILDWRGDKPEVLDPAQGNPDQMYYTAGLPGDPLEIRLTSWIVEFVVVPVGDS